MVVTGGISIVLVINWGMGMVTVFIVVLVKSLVSILVEVLVSLSVFVTGGTVTMVVEYEVTAGGGGRVVVLVEVMVR